MTAFKPALVAIALLASTPVLAKTGAPPSPTLQAAICSNLQATYAFPVAIQVRVSHDDLPRFVCNDTAAGIADRHFANVDEMFQWVLPR